MSRITSMPVNGYQPQYTGPLTVASYRADNRPDEPTMEKNSGSSTIILIGLAHCDETGQLKRVRMEMTPEDAKDVAMGMLALSKRVTQVA